MCVTERIFSNQGGSFEISNIFLRLKSSRALILNEIEHFSKVSPISDSSDPLTDVLIYVQNHSEISNMLNSEGS